MKYLANCFIGLLILASASYAEAIPVNWYYVGEVTALNGTYIEVDEFGNQSDPRDIDLNIGPYFSGYISYDTENIHSANLYTTFSSGHTASGNTNMSVVEANGIINILSFMWFDENANTQLCDPVAYFNFNTATSNGLLKFEFTDLAYGALEGRIRQFSNSPIQPVPESSTILLLAAAIGTALFSLNRKQKILE